MTGKILFALLLCICNYSLLAQTATVYGTVVDEFGTAVVAVTVTASGGAGSTVTDSKGNFEIIIPAQKNIVISFSHLSFEAFSRTVSLQAGQRFPLYPVLILESIKVDSILVYEDRRTEGVIKLIPEKFEGIPSISGLDFLKPFVSSGNELSSQYSVRGGNYDENLVYVNGFEIYRPLLVRSSQQEGLPFINVDMTNSVLFSAGGFQAKYGDKLSSVLDIEYKKPKKFFGIVSGSALGGSATLGGSSKKHRFTFIGGARYKTNQYLLNSLETKGDYRPTFLDFQLFATYILTPEITLEGITNYSNNTFQFIPEDRSTTFGLINQTLRLDIYFDGQEVDRYENGMGGLSLNIRPNQKTGIKFLGSYYRDLESETFDIIGEYFIGAVESNLGSSSFGETLYALGTGTNHEWGRNFLEVSVAKFSHKGYVIGKKHFMEWGADFNYEIITDELSEWERVDSAGYTLPYSVSAVNIQNVIRTEYNLTSKRLSAFLQDSWTLNESKTLTLNYGARFNYWDYNQQLLISPRMQFSWQPNWQRDVVFRFAAGSYDQPPFYRELRDLNGILHPDVKAQRSYHFVAASDYNFQLWGRPFKFVTEVYYKHLYDLNPYEIDNVRIRYFGENSATGYAAGVELRLNGEFVKDAESWVSFALLQTRENLNDDVLYTLDTIYDSGGNIDHFDSIPDYPGYIPRPTDQLVNVGIFFQDYIPGNENFKVHLNLLFASGLPTGPPDHIRARDTLRLAPYRRVDIGFSALLFNGEKERNQKKFILNNFETIWASLEVFNLLQIPNEISYTWVKDLTNTVYAVPNYLTSRRINLRVIVKF